MQAWQDVAILAAVALAAVAALVSVLALVRLGRLASEPVTQARLDDCLDRLERALRDEARLGREENAGGAAQLRGEVIRSINALSQGVHGQLDAAKAEAAAGAERLAASVGRALKEFGAASGEQTAKLIELQNRHGAALETRLTQLIEANGRAGEALRAKLDEQLTQLRAENAAKLDQMRATVDEKLQGTLEQRLGESFRLVSEQLKAVHEGLGEMQNLATGVGDLKRVLTNVKARGSWGEVQLGALLEHTLAPSQYAANAATGDGRERVEFAIRLPGQEEGAEVLLPIDAKFPVEDYQRLQDAADAADQLALAEAGRQLELRIRTCAREIAAKYINPPRTTDFAILFLPTEGLYAEVIRRPGLCDDLQREHRVTVAGPTTLTALLNSLQMGFRTLAIQKRSSEVWQVLGAVKTEFAKFGPVLERVKKKLQEASNTIDKAEVRERAIQRRLRRVEALPLPAAAALLGEDFDPEPEEAEEEPGLQAAE